MENRDLYLNLLRDTLTGFVYRDPPINTRPWWKRRKGFSEKLRHEGGDWPSLAHTMIGRARIDNIRYALETVIAEGIPGHFIETGVWRGGACIFARGVLKSHNVVDRKVIVADSFEGLPAPDIGKWPADKGDPHHKIDVLAISEAIVRENFSAYGLLDDQVEFIPGYFEQTLPGRKFGALAVVRLDGDMYGSTWTALEALYPQLSPGGFLIVDDYTLPNCRRAVHDYREQQAIAGELVPIDAASVYWRKS